jgi:hypothetical protein
MQDKAGQAHMVPWNVTKLPWNVTELPWNVTELPWNVTELPWNVTELPWNVTEKVRFNPQFSSKIKKKAISTLEWLKNLISEMTSTLMNFTFPVLKNGMQRVLCINNNSGAWRSLRLGGGNFCRQTEHKDTKGTKLGMKTFSLKKAVRAQCRKRFVPLCLGG